MSVSAQTKAPSSPQRSGGPPPGFALFPRAAFPGVILCLDLYRAGSDRLLHLLSDARVSRSLHQFDRLESPSSSQIHRPFQFFEALERPEFLELYESDCPLCPVQYSDSDGHRPALVRPTAPLAAICDLAFSHPRSLSHFECDCSDHLVLDARSVARLRERGPAMDRNRSDSVL